MKFILLTRRLLPSILISRSCSGSLNIVAAFSRPISVTSIVDGNSELNRGSPASRLPTYHNDWPLQ